jgi:hypothetical protein
MVTAYGNADTTHATPFHAPNEAVTDLAATTEPSTKT